MNFPSKKRLTLAEVLENLDFSTEDDEKDPMKSATTVSLTPPLEEYSDLPEEDSIDEDCTEFDLNNFGRKLPCAWSKSLSTGCNTWGIWRIISMFVSFWGCAK